MRSITPPLVNSSLCILSHLRPKPSVCWASSPNLNPAMSNTLTSETTGDDESRVGVYCFVSSIPGFSAVLKHRYADFIVNEVDLDGNVVHLTSFDVPPCEEEEEKDEKNVELSERNYEKEIELFRALCGDKDTELLKGLVDKFVQGGENDMEPIVLSADSDKSHRSEVHNFFKKYFKFFVTDTVEGSKESFRSIRVRLNSESDGRGKRGKKRKNMGNPKGNRPFDSRGSDSWPDHLGKFVRFNLCKENKDTQEALGIIAKFLGVQQRSFGFSGTKDKRAVTTQRVTIFKVHAKRLAALNNRLFGIKVGDFCYVKEGLSLGQLFGNRFTITLRNVIADSLDIVKAAATGLGQDGFINYYGLQRFGSGSVPTHLIGAALLRGEWKSAVELILDPRDAERDATREVREHYKETGDIDAALRNFPRYLVAERAILQCLKKCPGNYLQALKAIPRTLRMMYVHSYQSFLWNHAASMRVRKYGIGQVVIGDLVLCKEGSNAKVTDDNNVETEDDGNYEYNNTGLSDIDQASVVEEKVQLVKVVTSEDLSSGDYSFEDVVLPLPGSRIRYPENDVMEVFHNLAEKDGITLTESVHSAKEFSITKLTGGYRRVFQRPIDYKWELLTYTNGDAPLAETDLDVISKPKPDSANGNADYKAVNIENADIPDTKMQKAALQLQFTLPASCYATMAIRELLKNSTSTAYQKTINQ